MGSSLSMPQGQKGQTLEQQEQEILTFLDSNSHWLRPSSSTWFHHLRPTINLPVMFWKQNKRFLGLDSSLSR